MNYEVIGVCASVIVLISFLLKGEEKIRIVNLIGAILFVIYGLLIHAFSVWFLNSALVLAHLYKLIKFKYYS